MDIFKGKKPNIIYSKNSKNHVEEINYNKSPHTREVQRSKYIIIDDNRILDNDSDEDLESLLEKDLSKKDLKSLLGIETDEMKLSKNL